MRRTKLQKPTRAASRVRTMAGFAPSIDSPSVYIHFNGKLRISGDIWRSDNVHKETITAVQCEGVDDCEHITHGFSVASPKPSLSWIGTPFWQLSGRGGS